jgi:hypothetical protein
VRNAFFWFLAACWGLFFVFVFFLVLFPKAVPFFVPTIDNLRLFIFILIVLTLFYGLIRLFKAGMGVARRNRN